MSDEPEETAYYLRLMSMYIDLGTETVLDVFEYHSPARDPEEFLKKQEETIIKLKNIRILNKPESELLLQAVKTEDKVKESYVLKSALDLKEFDISLLITLSINLFSEQQLPPPAKGWDNPPRSSDKSIAADLLRLRRIRNLIVGHHPRARLPKWRFEKLWKEVSEIVVRIRQKVPQKQKINIQESIEAYRLQRLDPTVTNMYEKKIMEWSKDATTLQAQADDLIKQLEGFDAYFEKDCDRYEKYIALLVKGGRFVISALLENGMKKQERDLRSILNDSKDTLRKSITDSKQYETLFPSTQASSELDMSTWDISLLETVTLQIFGNSIGPLARDSVERIGNAYRNYAETAVIALDENRFADYSTDLTASIRVISLSGQIDQEQKNQCDQILEECKQNFSKASFKSSMEELKTQGSLLKSFTDIYKETIQQTKDCLQEMITHGISFDKSHELVLKMITLGHDDQKSKLAEKILREVWGEALDRSNQSTDFPEVKQEVSIILDEIKKRNPENISIKKGCIIMQISCTSASDMLAVINYFGSDKFYKTLRNIVQELGYYFNTAFAVFTVLPIDSLWGIPKCHKGDPTKTKEFGVCLPISVTSPADMLQLRSLINSEEIINSTNAIADALSKHLSGKITIKAEADMKELQKVFDSEMANSEKSSSNNNSISSSSRQQNAVFSDKTIRQMDENVASQECREKLIYRSSRKDIIEESSKVYLPTGLHEGLESRWNLLYELLLSQKEAARFLELAYYALREDPELARQVRNTADDAQNQHLITHGLVREYQGIALHKVKAMLQVIEIGMKKRKAVLVKMVMAKVLPYVDGIIEKTKATIEAYYKIESEVNKDISYIKNKEIKDIKDRKSAIDVEIKDKKSKIEAQEQAYKELKAKSQSIEETLKELKSQRQKYIEKSGLLTTGMATIGIHFRDAEAGKAILEGASAAETARNRQANEQAIGASEKTTIDLEKEQDMHVKNEKRLAKMKEDALHGLVAMEKLALEGAKQMNEESLKLASQKLGKVASLFANILLFWEDFSSKLTALSKSPESVELPIEFIDDPDLCEDISESMAKVKKGWNSFAIMCTDYVDESEKQLPKLYAFMSRPIDQMAVAECNKRKQKLLESHRAEIKAIEEKIVP